LSRDASALSPPVASGQSHGALFFPRETDRAILAAFLPLAAWDDFRRADHSEITFVIVFVIVTVVAAHFAFRVDQRSRRRFLSLRGA
jgi:hypothetical protein